MGGSTNFGRASHCFFSTKVVWNLDAIAEKIQAHFRIRSRREAPQTGETPDSSIIETFFWDEDFECYDEELYPGT